MKNHSIASLVIFAAIVVLIPGCAKPQPTPEMPQPASEKQQPTAEKLRPLSEINLDKAVVTPADLTFGGDYKVSEWQSRQCESTAWSTKDGWGVPETEYVVKFVEECWSYSGKDIKIDESIYVLGSTRQALRLAESIRSDRSSFLSMMGTKSEKTLEIGESSLWTGQGEIVPLQFSYVAMAVDEAVIFFNINGSSRFIERDLTDLATGATSRLRDAQKQ